VHDDTECDDLWTWRQQKKRGYAGTLVDNWIASWRDWYVNRYATGEFEAVDGGFDHCHAYGAGAVLRYVLDGDTAALAAAEAIADICINEASVGHDNTTLPNPVTYAWGYPRAFARWSVLWAYLAQATGNLKWLKWRNWTYDVYTQNTVCWSEAPTVGIEVGGIWHWNRAHLPDPNNNSTVAQYDAGRRFNNCFYTGNHVEALWRGYLATGRTDVRDRLIKLARMALRYAHVPAHTVPLVGSYWGIDTAWTYAAALSNCYKKYLPPDHMDKDDNSAACTYDSSFINLMTFAYKFTGETAFLTRARLHLSQCNRWADESYPGPTHVAPAVTPGEVYTFFDTKRKSGIGVEAMVFHYNKGQLQYGYQLFENGGAPAVIGAAFTPVYAAILPQNPGDVVAVAGDPPGAGVPYVSAWPTNVPADVRPSEISGPVWNTAIQCESHMCFLPSYSAGGAIGNAGAGGHHGMPHFGGWVFDFTDLRHKRIYTGGTAGESANVDVRTDTRVHNILHRPDDLYELYVGISQTAPPPVGNNVKSYNPVEWVPEPASLVPCPLKADPRTQTWEVTMPATPGMVETEPYPYAPTETKNAAGDTILSGPHGWPTAYAGQWAGMQGCARGGLVGKSLRQDPQPWPSTMPLPAHCWDLYFEVPPSMGGGPKGSVCPARHTVSGHGSGATLTWSYKFDLSTGVWSQFSVNDSYGWGPPPLPYACYVGTAGAYDWKENRMFIIPIIIGSDSTHINYLNVSDRTWRGLNIGAPPVSISGADRMDQLMCDHDRRLLMYQSGTGHTNTPNRVFRAFNLDTLTGPTPTAGSGGWQVLNVSPASGFAFDTSNSPTSYEALWVYYPPNGKYYKYSGHDRSGAYIQTPAGTFQTLERLTPPPYIGPPSTLAANYYITQPWVYDRITLNSPMINSPRWVAQVRYPKRLRYVPSLQLLAWMPLDGSADDPVTRNPVYLIKPQ
jgi:hypothetical protein